MKAKQENSRLLWEGSSWRLHVVQRPLPDGTVIEKGIIDHPGSVVMVPLHADQVLILRQYRLALDETILELPAGTRGWEEDWLVCAKRELREETGYKAETWTPLGNFWPAPGITNELMAIYLATDLAPAPLPGDVDEEIEVHPMPFDELVTMATNGQIQDLKTVVGILRAADHLRR